MNIARTNTRVASRPIKISSQAQQPKPTPSETKEIEDFIVDRRFFGNGILLNAPTKPVEDQVARSDEYLNQVIEKLAGPRLRKEGIHFRVSLLSSEHFQAFLEGHTRGAGWTPGRPPNGERDNPWAVRKFSGFEQDGKPMYEFAWHMGNFQTLKTEEEIAFVLAHELSTIFEGQVEFDSRPGRKPSFGSSNVAQLVADQHAVDMMVDAGYGTDGALDALTKVLDRGAYPTRVRVNFKDGELTTRGNQHHEGVRISAAQGKIEAVHNQNPSVRPDTPQTETPEELQKVFKADDPYRRKDMERMQESLEPIISDYFFRDEALPWIANGNPPDDQRFGVFHQVAPYPKEFGKAIGEALPVLENAQASSQKKVNAFFRLLRFGISKTGQRGANLEFTPEDRERIVDFLSRNSVGELGWQMEPFLDQLSKDTGGGWRPVKYPQQGFAEKVLRNPNFAEMFRPLNDQSSEWQKLIAKAPEFVMTHPYTGEKTFTYWLGDFASDIANKEKDALTEVHSQNIIDTAERLDLNELATGSEEHPGFHYYFPPLFRQFTEKTGKVEYEHGNRQRAELEAILEPHTAPFGEYRDRTMLDALLEQGQAKKDPEFAGAVVKESMEAQDVEAFTDSTNSQLGAALVDFSQRANTREGFLHTRVPNLSLVERRPEYSQGLGTLNKNNKLGESLTRLLRDPQLSEGDKDAIFTFLCCDHLPHKSLRAKEQLPKLVELHDYVKEMGSAKLVSKVQKAHRQHDALLIKLLEDRFGIEGVSLEPEALDDLAEQAKKEKILPVRHNSEHSSEIRAVAAKEFAAQVSPLTFAGFDRDLSAQLSQDVSKDEFESTLKELEQAAKRYSNLGTLSASGGREMPERISFAASRFLFDSLLVNKEQYEPQQVFEQASRILKLNEQALDAREEYRAELEAVILPDLKKLPEEQLRARLQEDYILSILSAENTAEFAAQLAGPDGSAEELGAGVKQVDQELKLSEDHPGTYQLFKEKLAKKAELQPHELDTVFPPDERTDSEQNGGYAFEVRGLSALVGLTRDKTPAEQISMIEYMMGREEDAPQFLLDAAAELEEQGPLMEVVRRTRTQLKTSDVMTRVLTANSFLAGPSGFIRKPEGMKMMTTHLLKSVRPKNRELAERLAEALVDSQGKTDSLAIAYVLGQREGVGGELDEATVLSNLFDAYGVPGIKLKQYLAFTSEFAEYREAFESAQDSANPITYLDAIRLLDERFDGEWPENLEIDKILGSGSVNVAIRYVDTKTGKKEVVQVGRDNIEATTDYDFFRFNRLLQSLTNTPEDKEKFGFLLGLTEIIKNSVGLELDKQASLEMQQSVEPLYKQKIKGWEVSSVPAFRQENMSIFMDEAKGKTARKMAQEDPDTYQDAMEAVSNVEFNALLGIDENRGATPVPLHANPDFHDGQVLIDKENKLVTILDFGQAVKITNVERKLALDLLTIISKTEGSEDGLEIINELVDEKNPISLEDLEEILDSRDDPMDAFVHILSLVGRHGGEVPMSSIHWVMGIHRQMALGEKIHVPYKAMVRNLVIVDQLGGSIKAYNRLHLFKEGTQKVAAKMMQGLSIVGGFLANLNPFG